MAGSSSDFVEWESGKVLLIDVRGRAIGGRSGRGRSSRCLAHFTLLRRELRSSGVEPKAQCANQEASEKWDDRRDVEPALGGCICCIC